MWTRSLHYQLQRIGRLTGAVIAHRWVSEAGQRVLELLISWCNRLVEEATWESYDLFAYKFPAFLLEDKAFYAEESNHTTPIKVYTRRNKKRVISIKLPISNCTGDFAHLESASYLCGPP